MWRGVQAIALAFVASCLLASPIAAAAEGERWASADGLVSVTIPEGWSRLTPTPGASHIILAVVAPSGEITRENPDLPLCTVEARPLPGERRTQAQINGMFEQMHAQLLQDLHPSTVHASGSDVIGGVTVLSLDVDLQGRRGPTRQMQRMFGVPQSAGLIHYQIGCGASGSAFTHTDMSVLQGFISSLAITPEATAQ